MHGRVRPDQYRGHTLPMWAADLMSGVNPASSGMECAHVLPLKALPGVQTKDGGEQCLPSWQLLFHLDSLFSSLASSCHLCP